MLGHTSISDGTAQGKLAQEELPKVNWLRTKVFSDISLITGQAIHPCPCLDLGFVCRFGSRPEKKQGIYFASFDSSPGHNCRFWKSLSSF